jgi:hypothetical protein
MIGFLDKPLALGGGSLILCRLLVRYEAAIPSLLSQSRQEFRCFLADIICDPVYEGFSQLA